MTPRSIRPPALLAGLALALAWALGAGLAAAAPSEEALREARQRTREGARRLQAGALERASEQVEAALRLVPDSVAARRNVALVLARRAEAALRRNEAGAALDLLDRALELHPGRLRYELLRGRALHEAGRAGDAQRAAEYVLGRSPGHGDALLLLADVQERAGDLDAAREALRALIPIRPGDGDLLRRLATLDRRAETEATFLTHGTGNFHVRYSPDLDPDTVRLALTLLEDAYARVTADLGLAPRTPARVVLYDGAEFQRVTGAHSWVGALYQNGTLRVPVRNLQRHRATASKVLTHEFTHHVLKERVPGLPVWWHEGIAQFVEVDAATGAIHRARLNKQFAPLAADDRLLTPAQLRGLKITSVGDPIVVNLFYGQSLSFVGWLVDTVGPGALPSFLVALGTGSDTDGAARRTFGADVDELFARWKDSL